MGFNNIEEGYIALRWAYRNNNFEMVKLILEIDKVDPSHDDINSLIKEASSRMG